MTQETFVRAIALEFDKAVPAQSAWVKNLDDLEYELAVADATIHSNLYVTWQGNAAVEFFAQYEPIYRNLSIQIQRLKDMAKIFGDEIFKLEEVSETLYPPTTVF
jgi:hypothetical protein